jgi:hypothetical protein
VANLRLGVRNEHWTITGAVDNLFNDDAAVTGVRFFDPVNFSVPAATGDLEQSTAVQPDGAVRLLIQRCIHTHGAVHSRRSDCLAAVDPKHLTNKRPAYAGFLF